MEIDVASAEQDNVTGESQETVESLKAQLEELNSTVRSLSAEATKHKSIRRQVEKERDELKSKTADTTKSDQDYKALWAETNEKLSKSLDRAKTSDIRTALAEQLTKAKVGSDKFGAAAKLVDPSLIEWDEESGVSQQSVVAAVQKLKQEHRFLFESTVDATEVKKAGDGGTQANTITRSAFEALAPQDRSAKMKAGVQLVED